MGFLPSNLNQYVDWKALFQQLGIRAEASFTPTTFRCPFCHQRCRLYNDVANGGSLYRCEGCASHGDMIQLAATLWKLTLRQTTERLAEILDCQDLQQKNPDAYIQSKRRESRAEALLSRARTMVMTYQPKAHETIGKFGLTYSLALMPSDRKAESLAGLFGVISKEEATEILQSNKHKRLKSFLPRKGWEYPLVIPYYVNKQHPIGLLFIGANGEYPEDMIYRSIYKNDRTVVTESGLAFMETVWKTSMPDSIPVLAMENPLVALTLQLRHLQVNAQPAPIVCWHTSPLLQTKTTWQNVPRKCCVWSPGGLRGGPLAQAIYSEGRISIIKKKQKVWSNNEVHGFDSIEKMINGLSFHSSTWRSMLQMFMESSSKEEVARLFMELPIRGSTLLQLLSDTLKPAELEKAKRALASDDLGARQAILRPTEQVVEHKGQWMFGSRQGESLLLNAIIRIEEIISSAESLDIFYRGRLITETAEIPFCEKKEVLEKDPFVWFQGLALANGGGVLRSDFSAPRKETLLEAALMLSNPVPVEAVCALGWDKLNNCFHMPNCTIHSGGRVEINSEALPSIECRFSIPGGKKLKYQEVCRCFNKGLSTSWAVGVSILANLLSEANEQKPALTILSGTICSFEGHQTAKLLGCSELSEQELLRVKRGWPGLLVKQIKKGRGLYKQSVLRSANAILVNDWFAAKILAIRYPIRHIHTEQGGLRFEEYVQDAWRVFPAYIQDVAARNFQIPKTEGHPWIFSVLKDLETWARSVGNRKLVVFDSVRTLITSEEVINKSALLEIAVKLISTGKMGWSRLGWNNLTGVPGVQICPGTHPEDSESVFLGLDAMNTALRRLRAPEMVPEDFVASQEANQVGELVTVNGNYGWKIPCAYWKRVFSEIRQVQVTQSNLAY